MTSSTQQWSALCGAGAVALVLAGCGTDGGVEEAVDPAGVADTGASDTGSGEGGGERVGAGSQVDTGEFMERLRSPGEDTLGSFSLAMEMDLEGQAMTMEGVADLRGEDPAMDISMTVPGMGALEMILVDGSMFIAVPGVTQEGQFIQMTQEELGMASGGDLTGAVDMDRTWDAWETGTESVTFVGVEDVDGDPMEHFRLLVDTESAMDASGETQGPGMPPTITYDVWVDDDDLMRQLEFELEGAAAELRIDDWGEPVDVQAPEESDLVEMPGFTP